MKIKSVDWTAEENEKRKKVLVVITHFDCAVRIPTVRK